MKEPPFRACFVHGYSSGNSGDDEMTPKKCEEFQNTEKVRRASGKVGETPEKWAGSPRFFGAPA